MTKYESTLMNIGKRNQQGFDAFRNTMLEDIAISLAMIADSRSKDVVYGEWIDKGFYYECSRCGYRSYSRDNYCSTCGADMKGGKDERFNQ